MSPIGAVLVLAAIVSSATAVSPTPADLLELPVLRGSGSPRPVGVVLEGARAVVSFWATYCLPCRAEVPAMRRTARRWRSHGVRVLGIAVDIDDPGELDRVSAAWGIDYETYRVPADAQDRVAALAPAGLPVTFFVGPDGVSRWDHLLKDADVDMLVPRRLGLPASASPRRE